MTLQEYIASLRGRTVAVIGIGVSNTPLLRLLLRAHLIEVLRVHAAHLSGHAHAHEGHGRARALIGRRGLHGAGLCAHLMSRRPRRVHERRVALHLGTHGNQPVDASVCKQTRQPAVVGLPGVPQVSQHQSEA